MQSCDINVKRALQYTEDLSKNRQSIEIGSGKYSPIFLAPTSNVKRIKEVYGKRKNALTVGKMGANIYELLLNGVYEIDCFDKNVLQYLYYELVSSAIKKCSYEEFVSNFTAQKSGDTQIHRHMLSNYLLFSIIDGMPGQAKEYWTNVFKDYDSSNLLDSSFAKTKYKCDLGYLKRLASMYDEESFYKLKDLLKWESVKINYHICDIFDISKEFSGKKYNLILFENILQQYQTLPSFNNVSNVRKQLDSSWSLLLDDDGVLELAYGYQKTAKSIREMKSTSNKKLSDLENMIVSNNFIINYLYEYDDCDIAFIPGVEKSSKSTENVVLTYKR